MALTERDRSVLYQRLNEVVRDEEAVGAMLSSFPARDLDEPATKDHVAASAAGVRADFADLRIEFADLRTELKTDFADLRTEFADLKTELKTDLAELRTDVVGVEKRLTTFVHEEIRASMRWTIGFVISAQAALVAAVAVFN